MLEYLRGVDSSYVSTAFKMRPASYSSVVAHTEILARKQLGHGFEVSLSYKARYSLSEEEGTEGERK